MNYQSRSFKLYFEGKLIGTVTDITYETPEFSGRLIPERGTATIHVKMGHFALGKQAKDLSRQH
jgi:hypothetical protein